MKHKIIIAGGRDFDDYKMLVEKVDTVLAELRSPGDKFKIVSGGATGADYLGEKYAHKRNCELKLFPANWDKYGKSAGYRRNIKMAKYANTCICFWDRKSKGTKHMINLAKEYNLELWIFHYND